MAVSLSFPHPITKLHPPAVRSNLVPRPQLYQRLNQCIEYRLLLISATAGSGKTTLLSQWSQQSEWPVIWVSLDAADNDPARFWSYIIMALDKLEPNIGRHLLPLLHSPLPPQADYLVGALINLATLIPDHFVLILDDYHCLEAEVIHTALAYLLDHLPVTMHLIVASRTEPPLPLARWRARGQLTELPRSELRFSAAETEMMLNQMIQLALTEPEVAALQERTQGWVAGLQLAALAIEEQPSGRVIPSLLDFQGNNRYLVDYLASEILSQQPESLRAFLLQTAILDQLSGPVCDAITGQSHGQAMLEQLYRRNLFITALDRKGQYAYHPLFADFLRDQLQGDPAYNLPELQTRAMAWYEQHGQLDQAIKHALAGGCLAEATRLIQRTARQHLMRGEAITLLNWFKALPDQVIRSEPLFCLIYAWVLTNSGQVEAAAPYLDHLEARLDPYEAQNLLLLGEAATVRARMGAIRDNLEQLACFSEQALRLLPQEASLLRSSALLDLAGVYKSRGDFEGAQAVLSETINLSRATGNLRITMLAVYYLAEVYLTLGQFQQAAQLYQQGLDWHRRLSPTSALSCWVHAGLGALLYEWNELAEALPHLRRAVELSQQSGEVKVMMYARLSLAQVLQTLEQPDEAGSTLQAATEIAQQTHIVEIARQVDLARVKLWLRQGEVDTAAAWLQQQGVSLQNKALLPHQLTMLAWLYLAAPQGLASEALARIIDLIKPQYEAALRGQLPLPQVQALIILTLAHQALGQLDEAIQKLAVAVAAAEPMGLIRTFTDQPGPALAPLLRQVASRKGNSLYLSRLMAAFEVHQASARAVNSPPAAPADPLIEALSQREVEILQRLAEGLSNQEIADELALAISTVKWYLRNIYDKLQVNRRTQALAKARELNLLDPS